MDAVFKALAVLARRSLLDELFREDRQTLSAARRTEPGEGGSVALTRLPRRLILIFDGA
jgi:hypothetical protein